MLPANDARRARSARQAKRARLGVDTGGTFTDFVLLEGDRLRIHKTLSTPADPSSAILEGIAAMGLDAAVKAGEVTVVHGSTVATNAALEGKGVRTAFVTNRGFTDLLSIGRQARRELYDLHPEAPPDPVPAELRLGTGGRLDAQGNELEPLTKQDLAELRERVRALAPSAVAVCLLHSYRDDRHERAIEQALAELAFVSRSSFVLPEYREYERAMATWLNAWLGPLVERYLDDLTAALAPSHLAVMQSSGTLAAAAHASRRAVNLLVSGPAGGLEAAVFVGESLRRRDLLTFDMGGTSTDVALLRGRPVLTDEGRVGPYPVAVPMADIHTIGAGGGSLARLDAGGALHVGPASAGADPGPACYGRGGTEPTVTDANLVLGRLPRDASLAGGLALDERRARHAIGRLAARLGRTVEETAAGIVAIADQNMAQALREISLERGHDPRGFVLLCFGGAGGLHVCALADALAMRHVIVPAHAGVFSALGMLSATPGRQLVRTVGLPLLDATTATIEREIEALAAIGRAELAADGYAPDSLASTPSVDARYRGQSYTLNLSWGAADETARAFHAAHARRYGHALALPMEIVNVRLELRAPRAAFELPPFNSVPAGGPPRFTDVHGCGRAAVVQREAITADGRAGPLIVLDEVATTWVAPGWRVRTDGWGHLHLSSGPAS